ncbi:MAG: serine hydrolase domain-containing protein [Bacteroidia bacterium]
MCRTLIFNFIICLITFSSCSNNKKTPTHKDSDTLIVNNDSILKILKTIHASAKAKQLDSLFKNKAKAGRFNGVVLIAQEGQIIYEFASGYSNIKTKDSLTKNSVFQLASTSKTLTAAAILLLKDQGKLKLTDTLQKYFPNFPYPNITIQNLLTHRSGLGNYLYFGEPYCDDKYCYNGKILNNNTLLGMMMNEKPARCFPPNKKFQYCNTNYALLASIVEKISSMNFSDFMQKNIFNPLGMKNTFVRTSSNYNANSKTATVGHTPFFKIEENEYADAVVGDKGVYSTVEDLFLWDQALYSNKLLKQQTIKEAFTGYSNEHSGKRNYGYGWRLLDNGHNDKIVYHNGWWHGYNSLFFRRPSDRTTIIILSNKDNRSIYQIQDIVAILNPYSKEINVEQ